MVVVSAVKDLLVIDIDDGLKARERPDRARELLFRSDVLLRDSPSRLSDFFWPLLRVGDMIGLSFKAGALRTISSIVRIYRCGALSDASSSIAE
jgi:hypothetical protein